MTFNIHKRYIRTVDHTNYRQVLAWLCCKYSRDLAKHNKISYTIIKINESIYEQCYDYYRDMLLIYDIDIDFCIKYKCCDHMIIHISTY